MQLKYSSYIELLKIKTLTKLKIEVETTLGFFFVYSMYLNWKN